MLLGGCRAVGLVDCECGYISTITVLPTFMSKSAIVKSFSLLSVDGEPIGTCEIRGNVKNGEVVRALEMVRQNNDSLLEWWREIHGDC